MKRLLSILLATVLILSFGVVSVSAAPRINATSYTLTKGYQTTLKVTGNSGSVRWSSSDTSVATVSSGKVVGKKVGTAVITAAVDGYSLKTTVNVVDTKITTNLSNVTVKKGESTTVTVTVTGTKTGLTLSNGNSTIAKGSWGNAKWNGNKISFTIKGVKAGTTTITVYRKNYRNSYYKTINVTVPGTTTTPTTPAAGTMTVSSKTLKVDAGTSGQLAVYYYSQGNIAAHNSNSSVATISAGTELSGMTGKAYNITGVSQGTTTITFYDLYDRTVQTAVTVTVTAPSYYVITTARPQVSGTDQVVTFQKNNTNYYMPVPYSYDEAVVNNAIAAYFRSYDYYTVYTTYPTTKASGDTIKTFYGTAASLSTSSSGNTGYPTGYPGYPSYTYPGVTSSARYMLLPKDADEVKANTAVSKYTGKYDYYTIYNSRPIYTAYSDTVSTWEIVDRSGVTITRYVLLPYGYDRDRLATLKEADLEANESFTYYKVLDAYPVNAGAGNDIFSWTNPTTAKARYMVVPRINCDFVARNDAVYGDTGKYYYFNAYSTSPTVADSTKEEVRCIWVQTGGFSKQIYVLMDKTDPDYEKKLNQAQSGSYYWVVQGNYAGSTAVY
ncbi:MAG: Ig-like domain-containing protein [Ruminococcus sp.]|jgi:hypothetical protein|nr:Ig-like domain-containing protein [Ruminococcus sp.]